MSKLIQIDFTKRGKDLRHLKKQRKILQKWDKTDKKIHKLLRRV